MQPLHESKPAPQLLQSRILRFAVCTIAVLPYLSITIHHYVSGNAVPTGFIQWDLPYYGANGRAVFERGNELAYPNPYDPSTDAPVIYFHWFVWVLGFGIVKLGLDPGAWFFGLGVAASLLCAFLTLRLVEIILPQTRFRTFLYLLTMWGGGFFCLGRAVANVAEGRPLADHLLAYDPFEGGWFLNWGRNLTIPTEALYHALVVASWISVLRDNWSLALFAAGAMASTHPFTGLQLLLGLFIWSSWLLVKERSSRRLVCFLALVLMLALFAWYYGFFLESYPQHREIRKVWSLNWTLGLLTTVLAYGPVGALALGRLFCRRPSLDSAVSFFVTTFLVSYLLANHHWFTTPRQPLHFTHGYIWMPLWLIGLPFLQEQLIVWRRRLPTLAWAFASTGLFAMGVSDNAVYLADKWSQPTLGLYLSRDGWNMLRWMRDSHLEGVLFSQDEDLSYLSATYTSLRPYYGHYYNTPRYALRRAESNAFFIDGRAGNWLAGTNYILVDRPFTTRTLEILRHIDARPWHILYENGAYSLLAFKEHT
jgi:hypothetical protein